MEMDRRSFLSSVGGVATVTFLDIGSPLATPALDAAAYAQSSGAGALNVAALRDRANADGEFLLKARYWDARLRLEVGNRPYNVIVQRGRIAEFAAAPAPGTADVRIAGPAAAWSSGFVARGLTVEGDAVSQVAPYRGAILRLIALVREANGARDEQYEPVKDVERPFDTAVGRYVYIRVQGVQYRVYFEETGQGIPMVLQHTAGSDGRQWRHLLEDTEVQKNFRLIAYDLPFHGKSVPPSTVRWWETEYRLTQNRVMDTIVAISRALKLDRPVYMGCSIGGYLAPDLALYHSADFRAVIGVNASIAGAQAPSQNPTAKADREKPISDRASVDPRYHPRINGESFGVSMYEITSPEAPDPYRRETGWVYSQGGPGVFAGDLYYYGIDHDLVGKAQQIDTTKTAVYLLSGEHDPSMQPGPRSAESLAKQIPGATFQMIKGGSHFAMSDDYPRFRQYLLPILEKIRQQKRQTSA
jgi:pimeloyl-ACP methyl ester carboxylesterase